MLSLTFVYSDNLFNFNLNSQRRKHVFTICFFMLCMGLREAGGQGCVGPGCWPPHLCPPRAHRLPRTGPRAGPGNGKHQWEKNNKIETHRFCHKPLFG